MASLPSDKSATGLSAIGRLHSRLLLADFTLLLADDENSLRQLKADSE